MAGQSFGPCSCPSELPETACHRVDAIKRLLAVSTSRSNRSRLRVRLRNSRHMRPFVPVRSFTVLNRKERLQPGRRPFSGKAEVAPHPGLHQARNNVGAHQKSPRPPFTLPANPLINPSDTLPSLQSPRSILIDPHSQPTNLQRNPPYLNPTQSRKQVLRLRFTSEPFQSPTESEVGVFAALSPVSVLLNLVVDRFADVGLGPAAA